MSAANDARYYQNGHWKYDTGAGTVQVSDPAFVLYEFRIIELINELLKIEMR